jgi:hypothetical protein
MGCGMPVDVSHPGLELVEQRVGEERTCEMYNGIWCLDLIFERLADSKVTRETVESLSAVCKVRFQCIDFWVVQRRYIDIEYLVSIREQLLNNMATCYSRTAREDYSLVWI